MELKGQLKNPDIHTYYVTGSLEQKGDNQPLQKMLEKIKNGGMNVFLNSKLKKFAQGLRSSFEQDGYINKDNSLTPSGEDIVKTGKSWHSLQGAFLLTILDYHGKMYLLDAEPVKASDSFIGNPFDKKEFNDDEYAGTFRKIKTDERWADWKEQPKNKSVAFQFDYAKAECTVTVQFNDKHLVFTTTETNDFFIINRDNAMTLLEEREKEETVFEFDAQDTTAVRIYVSEVKDIERKSWLQDFFENGIFSLPVTSEELSDANDVVLENLCLYCNDNKTVERLLTEYLLRKSEISYLGYEETGRFVNEFQNLFVSPDGNKPACPPIMRMRRTKMISIYVYVLDTMADWEIGYVTAELHSRRFFRADAPEVTVRTAGVSKEPVRTMGGLTVVPDCTVGDIVADTSSVLLLPGANTWDDPKHGAAVKKAAEQLAAGGTVCAICGATVALARAGLFEHRRHTSNGAGFLEMVCPGYKGNDCYADEPSVADGNLITAGAAGALAWARQIIAHLGVFRPDTLEAWHAYFSTGDARHFFTLMQTLPGAQGNM